MTRILGIDPGLTRCGIGLIELGAGRKVKLLEVQVFRTSPDLELSARIASLGDRIEAFIAAQMPDVIALERVYADANLRSVMGTAQISGVVLLLANRHKLPIALHTPTEVKAAVTGSGRADKAQVGHMVAKVLGLPEIPKPADAADALAIAICHAWRGTGLESASSSGQTVAQRAWQDAIAQSQRKSNT